VTGARRLRSPLAWAALAAALAVPAGFAVTSPLLAWRDPIYIAAGFAGVVALGFLLLQPLLAGGYLPGLGMRRGRRLHAWVGAGLVVAVLVHVVGLWLTSPPDVVDALLFRSPTSFSAWGVVAMWAVFATALLAALRARLRLRLLVWRLCHVTLALVIVVGTAVHAVLIDGTMEPVSKAALVALAVAALAKVMVDLRIPAGLRRLIARQVASGSARSDGPTARPKVTEPR
jgi:predicted ferric reductase